MAGSAVSNISKILSDINAAVNSLSGQADGLISRAEAALKDSTTFPEVGPVVVEVTDYIPTYSVGGEISGMPVIPDPILPEPPSYNSGPVANFFGGPPQGNGPAPIVTTFTPTPIQPGQPINPPTRLVFSGGSSGGEIRLPPTPDVFPDFTPRFLSVSAALSSELTLNLPPIDLADLNDLDLTVPDMEDAENQFKGFVYNGVLGIPGFTELSAGLGKFSELIFNELSGELLREIDARLADPYATVNALKETRLQTLFAAQEQAIRDQQTTAVQRLTTQSGWDLPVAVQRAMQRHTEQLLDSWVGQAEAQRQTQIMEHAQKLFEVCVEVYRELRQAIEDFRVKEIEMVLSAHQDAIAYAKQKTQVLLKIFDLENYRQYDLDLQRAEVLLQQLNAQLEVDFARYDFVKTQIELERLKQQQDAGLIAQYSAKADALKARTQAVAQQVEAAQKEVQSKEGNIKAFRAKVQQFDALVDAESANLARMLSLIEGNNLNREAELAKLGGYETEIKAFETAVAAKDGVVDAAIASNRAKLDAFDGMSKAAMVPVDYSLLRAQYDLYAHEINANNYIADAELAMNFKKMDLDFMKQKRELRDELLRDFQELALDMANVESGRKQAIAEVAVQCARVIASMAEGAMSAGNMVASATIEELA